MENKVDVIYVEDDSSLNRILGMLFDDASISTASARSLEGLKSILGTTRARVYILDGRFPEHDTDLDKKLSAPFNANKALEFIRATVGEAVVLLYSSEVNSHQIATEMGIEWADKNQRSLMPLIQKIQNLLSN